MSIAIFTWCPRLNASATTKYATRQAQFGDGYMQVAGNGLNPRSQEWSLEFTGSDSYIRAIKDFIDAHQGVQAFQWQPPLEAVGLYRCDNASPTALGNDKYNLALVFKTAYSLATNSSAQIKPTITRQPDSVGVYRGNGATFSVVAAGSTPFTYRWEKLVSGSWQVVNQTQSYTITQTNDDHAGTYRVTVANAYGSVVSNSVTLEVQAPPVAPTITQQPPATTAITVGDILNLAAAATGTGTITWQWQVQSGTNWNNIPGALNATLTLANVQLTDAGIYRAIATNNYGNAITDNAAVTVGA